ncbi:VapA/VapB family virulence-associated protein [Lacinutrix neustonica]|uniref:VapA/VapB family virulence-associated protein n=1 Tax=Lacinutrix neustonica TaxID=2980107 RepID=A0A9E8MTY8_9FLAO|nr:VapA/VapB family virulence-associated protein [Lacinutrix neustonica]WAC01286.1 VapA/VapB family virulence-associated protein [Lacinutrix neustonica]
METTLEQTSTLIAHDFVTKNTGVLDQEKIDAAVKTITAETQSYPANGSVASFIFYLKFQVNITGGKSFNGNAGGASTPGGGALIGDVYTSDINRLYKDTKSFQFNATPVYTSIIFFDGSSNVLGTFQAGAVSTVAGIGGGSGSWS